MATTHSLNAFAQSVENWGQKLIPSDELFCRIKDDAERFSKTEPGQYKLRLVLLGLIGYAYIAFIFSLFIALVVLLSGVIQSAHLGYFVLFKLAIIIGVPMWAIARSMWISFPPPEGVEVERHQAPKLFELLDQLSAEIGTRVDKVVIDTNFNAAITQVPRFGLFGFHQNYLIIGLPLIQSFSLEHFKAVIAHELGHLSGNHSKSTAWAYSLQARWSKILTKMRDESPLVYALFYLFFCWYSPRFTAYSMVKAREQEIQADKDAAQLTSEATVAQMLAILSLKSRWYDDVLDSCWKRIYDSELPPKDFHNLMASGLAKKPDHCEDSSNGNLKSSKDPESWLSNLLKEETKGYDSHPSFRDRVESVSQLDNYSDTRRGVEIVMQHWSPQPSAFNTLLGERGVEVESVFNTKFSGEVLEYWKQAHQEAVSEKKELEELRQKDAEGEKLSVKQLNKLGYLTSKIEGEVEALEIYNRVLKTEPDDPQANYYIGADLLLERKDESGIDFLRKAMSKKYELVEPACNMIIHHLNQVDRTSEIEEYEKKLETHYKYLGLATEERCGITDKDLFQPHDISQEWIDIWRAWFATVESIERVHLVRKQVEYFPDTPYYAVGVVMRRNDDTDLLAYTMLAYMGEDQFCVTIFDAFNKKMRQKMERIDDSIIYERLEHMHLADFGKQS